MGMYIKLFDLRLETRPELVTFEVPAVLAVDACTRDGVPQEKRASVERLLDLAKLFRRRVIASRIPEIVRTPDAWLRDRTILETLRADGVDPIYAYLGRLFNYGGM